MSALRAAAGPGGKGMAPNGVASPLDNFSDTNYCAHMTRYKLGPYATTPAGMEVIEAFRMDVDALLVSLEEKCPECYEKDIARQKLKECLMWGTSGIARMSEESRAEAGIQTMVPAERGDEKC